MMLINPLELTKNDNSTVISSLIQYSGKEEKLWYSVDRKYSQYLTADKLDGFLIAVLPFAMLLGEDLVVKGAVSEKLYHNLINYHMHIVREAIPSLKLVKIIPDTLYDGKNTSCEGAVGTGFTGGIDSYFTVLRYLREDDVPPKYKITHLIFCNVGSHGRGDSGRNLFNSRYELLKGFPEEVGIDFIKIDSNVSDILRASVNTAGPIRTLCLQMRYLSGPLLLQSLFSKYYFSASFNYKDSFTGRVEDDIAHIDPSAIHLLSTDTLEFILSGAQHTRVEKTKQLALSGIANRYLNVCIDRSATRDGTNCSECHKCCRTLFTLEMLNAVDQFSDQFNLKKWKKSRSRYIISQVLGKGRDLFAGEIRDYAASTGYSFPIWQRVLAQIFSFEPVHYLAKGCYKILRRA